MNAPAFEPGGSRARQIASLLLRWYDRGHRDLPWRHTRDPYAIWLSETMLQQTQVQTVIPYYERFLAQFPTVAALAQADLADVLALWAGLGYYRRARHLHEAARQVVERHGGQVPATVEGLRGLPGVGRYTAGAVASIAFDQPAPVVDGNVMRVLARLHAYDRDISAARHQAFFWEHAEQLVRAACGTRARPHPRCGDLNQALMEFGATVCTPVSPMCRACPLRRLCVGQAEGRQGELPVKAARKASAVVRRKALIILRRKGEWEEVLLLQRPAGGLWEHMWEFPTVSRNEVHRRPLGLALRQIRPCGSIKHQLSHRTFRYEVILARCPAKGDPRLPRCDGNSPYAAWRWVEWPLSAGLGLPLARVVHKLAAAARHPRSPKR
jgi:A/G-specific adenine glycosylase